MSITLELSKLSPELAKQLAAMSEEERESFITVAIREKLEDGEDDLMVGPPSSRGAIPISRENMDKIVALSKAPPREPTERMKKALENHRRLSGRA